MKSQEPKGTNEASGHQRLTTAPVGKGPWTSWDQVPTDAHEVAAGGPWFVEIFSGTAHLTDAVRKAGIPCLPPIDITICSAVPTPFDVVDAARWQFLMQLILLGAIWFAHFGTPCNTYSAARKQGDGGPPPLRSSEFPDGLPSLAGDLWYQAFLGNLFKERTCEACSALIVLGKHFSIENPLGSLIWDTPALINLSRLARAFHVDFDQCAFGAPSKKPTRLLVSHQSFQGPLSVSCPGNHRHEVLKGKVFSAQFGRVVFRTKLAQVYPSAMCSAMAHCMLQLWQDPLRWLRPSFQLVAPKTDRKRPLGQQIAWKHHRQHRSALAAEASGYQLKRGARKPLLDIETEPGEAMEWVMQITHPFSVFSKLEDHLASALDSLARDPALLLQHRAEQVRQWTPIAHKALQTSDFLLRQISDGPLRRLLRGVPDHTPAILGKTCNIELYRLMLQAVNSVDQNLPSLLLHGFPIVGPIDKSHRWPPFDKPQKVVAIAELQRRAWEIRKKIIKRVSALPVSENLKKIWESTIEDVEEGSCIGPFQVESEVTSFLGQDDWIPTQRFEVVQKNKVRGCDSATTNLINQATEISEKLQLPSTDTNVSALRSLLSKCPDKQLLGWVLDERKAYRQVPIRPTDRKYSVITMKNPESGRPAFFVMVGHSFGLVSAVYNYNRRSAAINEFLVSIFGLVAFSFYDDKYGFEIAETARSAHEIAQLVHWWLGAQFDAKKLQLSSDPTILGVTYNLDRMVLEIKEARRQELMEEIDARLKEGLLDPGSAGKLKGKLMFGASQLWGKVGRAFLRPISERQYARFAPEEGFTIDEALRLSLMQWKHLVQDGPPRPIDLRSEKPPDAVLFTDGFTPDPRSTVRLPDRVGAVLLDRNLVRPLQFTAVIPKSVQTRWLVRKTQIVPVEMVAPILALQTFKERLFGADIILLIDSEAVEAALIKGYSSKEDLCQLISVFWDIVFELKARVFIDRIATDANPADWPSRDDLRTGEQAGWKSVQVVWPSALVDKRSQAVQYKKRQGLGRNHSVFRSGLDLDCLFMLGA